MTCRTHFNSYLPVHDLKWQVLTPLVIFLKLFLKLSFELKIFQGECRCVHLIDIFQKLFDLKDDKKNNKKLDVFVNMDMNG